MKKYIGTALLIVVSWFILLFIYNYRSNAAEYGLIIPGFMTLVELFNARIFNDVLIPKFYFKHRFLPFIFFSFSTVILSTWLQMLFVFGLFLHIRFDMQSVTPRLQNVIVIISSTWLIVLGSIAIRQTAVVAANAKHQERISREMAEAELQLLKAQINPHFLFNTLNSIYVLAKRRSDKTPEMILKLSQILDFLLYRTGTSKIEVGREIEFIRDYLELEKLRYGEKLEITFQTDIREPDRKIEPVIFIPLVENAFKHGVKGERKKARVFIEISDGDGIHFSIRNTKPKAVHQETAGGIGLKNLQNRLNRTYNGRYDMTIEDSADQFFVDLNIRV